MTWCSTLVHTTYFKRVVIGEVPSSLAVENDVVVDDVNCRDGVLFLDRLRIRAEWCWSDAKLEEEN